MERYIYLSIIIFIYIMFPEILSLFKRQGTCLYSCITKSVGLITVIHAILLRADIRVPA
jgi:hypothetical protein